MFVKPTRAGLIVRDPRTRMPVPPEGREVPRLPYWIRRINDGSLERAEPQAAAPPAEAEKEAEQPQGSTSTRPRRKAGRRDSEPRP